MTDQSLVTPSRGCAEDLLGSDLLGFPALGNLLLDIIVIGLLGSIVNALLYASIGVEVVKVGSDLAGRWSPPLTLRSGLARELRREERVSRGEMMGWGIAYQEHAIDDLDDWDRLVSALPLVVLEDSSQQRSRQVTRQTHLCRINDHHVFLGVVDVRLVERLEDDDVDIPGHVER
jgi:hypothetical protein